MSMLLQVDDDKIMLSLVNRDPRKDETFVFVAIMQSPYFLNTEDNGVAGQNHVHTSGTAKKKRI